MKDTLKDKIRTEYIHKQLVFVHTPKCGGTYATNILKDLGIPNKEHVQAKQNVNIVHFTIIRHPIDRFESLLNYRLSDKEPRKDWPRHLRHVYNNAASLDTIVGRMSDANITGFYPFKSLVYWTKNVDICITINELQEFLALFGYNYDPNNYARTNVSQKKRGTLSPASRARIAKIFKADIDIFNKWTGA
jgi:hypothetical protein